MKQIFSIVFALTCTVVAWAQNNVITYTATFKLNEVTDQESGGLHTNAFGDLTITSHEFANCKGTITFSADVTTIGDYAFRGNGKLFIVNIPGSVTSIGNAAFAQCGYLTVVNCNNASAVPALGTDVFASHYSDFTIYVPTDNVEAYKAAEGWSAYAGNIVDVAQKKTIFTTWHGDEGIYRINTGLDDGSELSGIWKEYTDNADGGQSKIEYSASLGADPSFDDIIDYYGGMGGSYTLGKGAMTFDPYVGVYFNIGGEDEDTGAATPVDATSLKGISITYQCDHAVYLEMGLGDEGDEVIGYDNPAAALPKSSVPVTKVILWSSFKQAGWGKAIITGLEAAAKLASLKFYIKGANGWKGNFVIYSIGQLDGESHKHDWNYNVTQQPTCTAVGYQQSYCAICDKTKEGLSTVEALGHDFGTDGYCKRTGCTEYDEAYDESKATAIDTIDAQQTGKTIKTVIDGRIVFIRNGEKYDITGRKL